MLLKSSGLETHELVSECYVHGFMHGEMLQGGLEFDSQMTPIKIV